MLEGVAIRPGRLDDASAVAVFGRRTFDETFGPHNRASDHLAFLNETYGEEQQARELADPGWSTLLAEVGEDIVGLAQIHTATAPPCVDVEARTPIELVRFYVDRPWHGTGLAGALLYALEGVAAARGADAVWLSVWKENARAMAFYERSGFRAVGEHTFVVGDDPQPDWLMLKALSQPL